MLTRRGITTAHGKLGKSTSRPTASKSAPVKRCSQPSCARRSRCACTTPTRRPGPACNLRCIVRHSKPADVTDTTLATELLFAAPLPRIAARERPPPRHLQARIVAHLADTPQVNPACDIVIKLVRHYLETPACRCCPKTSRPDLRARCASGPAWGGCIHAPE